MKWIVHLIVFVAMTGFIVYLRFRDVGPSETEFMVTHWKLLLGYMLYSVFLLYELRRDSL